MPIARMLQMARQCQISLVNYATGTSGTSLSLTGLGLQAGDFVFAWSVVNYIYDSDGTGSRPASPSAGWTEAIDAMYNNTLNIYGVHKIMSEVPDDSVTLKVHTSLGVMMAVVFRGIQSSSPVLASGNVINSLDPPSVSAGSASCAVSLALAMLNGGIQGYWPDVEPPTTAPSGWTMIGSIDNQYALSSATAAAYKTKVTGTVDPGAFSGEGNETDLACFHFVLGGA